MRHLRTAVVALALLMVAPGAQLGWADSMQDAAQFLQSLADQAIAIHADTSLSAPEREQALGRLIERFFDLPTIGRFAAGRYWRSATPEQRRKYQTAFHDFSVRTVASRMPELDERSLKITGTRREGELDIIVASLVTAREKSPTRVMWRLRRSSQNYKILDVIIEGVSMLITQRDEFSSAIRARGGTLEALIPVLREKIGAPGSSAAGSSK